MTLRQEVHSTILTLSADQPLVIEQRTPIEVQGAAFLMGCVHQADLVVGLRLLDSGTAKDVSGVLRISGRPGEDDDGEAGEGEDRELLYFVEGSGGVRVFERGS